MLIVILVNLYVSKVALNAMGVVDYGIYNLVAGVVVMFSFLNNTMSAATSRFLTYEMGKKNDEKLKKTFQVSLFLHLVISLVLVLLAEGVGVWFINNHLVIPPERMAAANWVFQFAILTMVVKIIQVPFNSTIISNERMDVYAWIEIFYAISYLLLVWLLKMLAGDKLIYYGLIVLFVAIVSLFAYIIYCLRHFEECRLKLSYDKEILKPMLTFSGYDLYANLSATFKSQGISIVINWFYGPALNAANAIANQIQSAIFTFSSTVTSAFRPQIIKRYASNEIKEMENMLRISSILSVFLFCCIAVPIIIDMDTVLKIWLGTPPEHTVGISRVMLMANFATLLNTILIIPIHAKGLVKRISLWGGTIYLMTIPAAYFVTKLYVDPLTPYYVMGVFMLFLIICTSIVLKIEIPSLNIWSYYIKSIIPAVLFAVFAGFITYNLLDSINNDIVKLLLTFIIYGMISLLMYMVYFYYTASLATRNVVVIFLKSKIKWLK